MPLKVKCPNGCVIRMPRNRAGKKVRCPGCKSALKIPRLPRDAAAVDAGQAIELTASIANKRVVSTPKVDNTDTTTPAPHDPNTAATLVISASNEQLQLESFPVLQESTGLQNDREVSKPDLMTTRIDRARKDRIVLARFFAACLCIVAIVNMVPAIYHWSQWSEVAELQQLPRWTYLQIFVAAMHFVYAFYLFQINDWSALRTVSIVMIIVGSIFGAVSAGLALGGAQGSIARFLNLPYVMIRSASVWCVAMLCLATLTSYLVGREATNWRRIEQLIICHDSPNRLQITTNKRTGKSPFAPRK